MMAAFVQIVVLLLVSSLWILLAAVIVKMLANSDGSMSHSSDYKHKHRNSSFHTAKAVWLQ